MENNSNIGDNSNELFIAIVECLQSMQKLSVSQNKLNRSSLLLQIVILFDIAILVVFNLLLPLL